MQVLENMAAVCGSGSPPLTPYETSAPLSRRRGVSRKSSRRRRSAGAVDRSDNIRVRSARIFWSDDPASRRVCDVWVSTTDQPEEAFTAEYFSSRWTFVVGNCDVEWLRDPLYTPEAVFGQMVATGFASPAEAINAIGQFAKIDACGWARAMLPRIEGWRL
jgi:hypothetical protein